MFERPIVDSIILQEQHTLQEVKEALERVTAVSPKPA